MSLKKIIAVLILTSSSLVFADPASAPQDKEHQRMWTILASENNASKGNLDNKKLCTDPGVFVTAQRDPHDNK